jgi:hypothetical protein
VRSIVMAEIQGRLVGYARTWQYATGHAGASGKQKQAGHGRGR